MCGIIGVIGREAAPIILDGLQRLEYRGYDSAGIALHGKKITLTKKKGRVQELREILEANKSRIGIGHTRWATHGPPSDVNSHPHADCKTSLCVVHNGIIENHETLKQMLLAKGHTFSSDTDTEVLAHLIESFYDKNLQDAVRKALTLVEGAFGVVVMHRDEELLVVARRGSPIVLGVAEEARFVASDVPALLEYTRNVIYLEDNEMAVLRKNSHQISRLSGEKVEKELHEIKYSIAELEKGMHKHFMLKEIFEQPRSLAATMRGRLAVADKRKVDINTFERIVFLGCGTSWHAGLIGQYIIEKMTGIPVSVEYASEFRYREPVVSEKDLVIAISQSGETADTLAALYKARERGAQLFGLVNSVGSTIARYVDRGMYLHAGPEIGVASTKAFTSQVTAIILLALQIKYQQTGKVDQETVEALKKLPEQVEEITQLSGSIRKIAKKYVDNSNFLYLGRGVNFPVALEGALKLKEISYIHAEGYPAAEMKHGPIALIDDDMPVFFIAPRDETYEKILSNMQEVRARGGRLIALVTEDEPQVLNLADDVIVMPRTNDYVQPILSVIPLQLFSYHVADLKGLDVDKPRNLAKSVTVE